MWRFDLADLTEDDIRALRMLVKLKRAEAHLVVRTDPTWPVRIKTRPQQWQEPAKGAAIH